jgi:hypothetical protein
MIVFMVMKTFYVSSLLTLVLISATCSLSAQNRSLRLGIKGGLDLSYLTIGQSGLPGKILPGINAGFTATYGVGSHFSLQSGLSFSTKGGRISGKGPLGLEGQVYPDKQATIKTSELYLQVPLYALYRFNLSQGKGIIINAGPYVAQGIGGNTSVNGTLVYGDMIMQDELKEKTFGSRGLKKFDYGVGAGVAIDLGEYILGVNYELGLKDIGPDQQTYMPFYNTSYKNRNLTLSVEYRF